MKYISACKIYCNNNGEKMRVFTKQDPEYPKIKEMMNQNVIVSKMKKNVVGTGKYKGEKHVPLLTKSGVKISHYTGPGTNVIERIRDGSEPITNTDRVSQKHDIDYTLADSVDDISKADDAMLKNLKKIRKNKSDYRANIAIAEKGIQAKKLAERFGILKKGSFGNVGSKAKLSNDDKILLMKKLNQLNNEFMGMGHTQCGGGIFAFLASTFAPMVVEGIINTTQGKNFFTGKGLTKQMKEELDPMEMEFAKELKKAVNAELKKRKITGEGVFGSTFIAPELEQEFKNNKNLYANLFGNKKGRQAIKNLRDLYN